jgi:4-hydroxy-3-methylbut-2-enyl diphosphate reductase
VFDATCPLVTKVHIEVIRHQQAGRECVLIGHAGHPEVEGTMGQYQARKGHIYLVENVTDAEKLQVNNPRELSYVTQTTLSMDDTAEIITALNKRFPGIQGPKKDDICYATQNRQDAVKELAPNCDLVLVVGSKNSSNSNRLRELAQRLGTKAYLLDTADQIDVEWLNGVKTVGVTAGASAPEILVEQVIKRLESLGGETAQETQGTMENVVFSLPKALQV